MSDRVSAQPLPANTADHDSARGEAAPQHGETGDDVPDQGDTDSGARQGPSEGAGDSEHSGPDEYSGPGEQSGPDEPAGSGGAGPRGRHGTKPAKARRRHSFWRELPVLIITALVIALLIKTFVLQAFFIPSGSMENTLQINDKILVNKLVYHFRNIQPGDIVVFDGAGSWTPELPSHPSSDPIVRAYDVTLKPLVEAVSGLFGTAPGQTDFIKRVIGVPGDHVVCCNAQGLVTVNGVALHEQSYLFPGSVPSDAPAGYSGRVNITVPPGRLSGPLHHHGAARPPVSDGQQPARLRRLAPAPDRPGPWHDPGEPGHRPGLHDRVATVAVAGPPDPVDVLPRGQRKAGCGRRPGLRPGAGRAGRALRAARRRCGRRGAADLAAAPPTPAPLAPHGPPELTRGRARS